MNNDDNVSSADSWLTEKELGEIEKRANRATPGPWAWEKTGEKTNAWCLGTVYPEHEGEILGRQKKKPLVVDLIACREDNANYGDPGFISHARTDIPKLLREVRRMRALLAVRGDTNG
jgi:hypothetical protein